MLSLNEIRDRAYRFAQTHEQDHYEKGETQSFWNDFFDVFGIERRQVAVFEQQVKKLGERQGFIDCFWPGQVLIEHKSKGKSLEGAFKQALDYFAGLRPEEIPRFVLVSDFQNFRLYDLERSGDFYEFGLSQLPQKIELFLFMTGREKVALKDEDPVNLQASRLMAAMHDQLKAIGYQGHDLEVFLVRLLFGMFAEDTDIFRKRQLEDFIRQRTAEDGSDLGAKLDELFEVLNTPEDQRLSTLDEELNAFPYVNGKLFEERLRKSAFNAAMRLQILECMRFDWSRISPAIFGSLFQHVMDPRQRRDLGAHYTDEKNILKLIRPLFLDGLREELEQIKGLKRHREERLEAFHRKLEGLDFFDPACGCGNFLVIAYRELRRLELDVLKATLGKRLRQRQLFDVAQFIRLDVNRFHGIEIEEFSARIAEVSLWLMDHLMNREAAHEFGQHFARIPLKASANIRHGNALRLEWSEVLPAAQCDYIIGNPPFYGSKLQSAEQRSELAEAFKGLPGAKVLDYVACWYKKAAEYMNGRPIEAAFVSTNSICQGEQVGLLWGHLTGKYGLKISFAHQTFKWSNQASGKAQVFVVIVGFAQKERAKKLIFEYDTPKSDPVAKAARQINAYLVDGPEVFLEKRNKPLCESPKMQFGNMPLDGGSLILNSEERRAMLEKNPEIEIFIKPLISAKEFLNNGKRWCLWLKGASPEVIRNSPEIKERVNCVREFRLQSIAPSTRQHAETPSLFRDTNNPKRFILVPRHSSENRKYIPLGFFEDGSIPSDSCLTIPNATLYHFGMLTSAMHMAWTNYTCGRLEGRTRYSKDIVYNNFPWPEAGPQEKAKIEALAQAVLEARAQFPASSLADLYDPLAMPPALLKAHHALDKAADQLYRSEPFASDAERVGMLFERYGAIAGKEA